MLSDREKLILSQAEFHADEDLSLIARRAGLKTETVAYGLRRLEEQGVITYRTFINLSPLGFQDVAVFFSLASGERTVVDKVLRAFVAHPQVAWLGALAGDFQYASAFHARDLLEVSRFLESVCARAGEVFGEKLLAPRLRYTRFQRKYLAEKKVPARELGFEALADRVEIDESDDRILQVLGNSSCPSLRELSRRSGLPLSTVERRVRRLKEKGVIVGGYYEVSLAQLGVESWRIMVSCKSLSAALRQRLYHFCQMHRHVSFFVEALGSWDYEIIVEAARSSEVMSISQEVADVCGAALGGIRVFTEINELKSSYYPALQRAGR